MNRIVGSICVLGMAVASAAVAEPKNIFVSTDPEWKVAGLEGDTYTDLQTAVNTAGSGDTVWIQDGFVCDEGHGASIQGTGGYPRVVVPNAPMTIRSESGYVDEAKGWGAYIRGSHDPTTVGTDGSESIRPLQNSHAQTVFMGLVLENGGTADNAGTGLGGAVWGPGVFSNCVMRGCSAHSGGAICNGSCRLYNCVVTNNSSFGLGYGGGAVYGAAHFYDCEISYNYSKVGSGGAIFCGNTAGSTPPIYSNCVFRGNVTESDIAVANLSKPRGCRALFYDCLFEGNVARGGIASGVAGVARLTRCTFVNNSATNKTFGASNYNDGGAVSLNINCYGYIDVTPDMRSELYDCVFSNNFTVGTGGGFSAAWATNCTVVGNTSFFNGGGAFRSILFDCDIIGNCATNSVKSDQNNACNGGGLSQSTATRCRIVGNRVWSVRELANASGGGAALCNLYNCTVTNNWALYRGAAVYNPGNGETPYECCNCLFADNRSGATSTAIGYDHGMLIEGTSGNAVPDCPATFVNCTIVGNRTDNWSGINAVKLSNCIVWDNQVPVKWGELSGNVVCDHTCQKDLTPGTDDKNLNCNPKLTADYRPGLPVKNKGRYFSWMDDEDDARSRDLAGGPRLLGTAPDLGCYEPPVPGLTILVR